MADQVPPSMEVLREAVRQGAPGLQAQVDVLDAIYDHARRTLGDRDHVRFLINIYDIMAEEGMLVDRPDLEADRQRLQDMLDE